MNKCFGSKDLSNNRGHDTDKDQSGWTAFCETLPSSKIEKLVLSDVGMGPVGLTTLANIIFDSPALSEVSLTSRHVVVLFSPFDMMRA